MSGLLRRLFGGGVPVELAGALDSEEHVIAQARQRDSESSLFATSLGLWVPGEERPRRVGWHMVSKVTWAGGLLTLIEARETGMAGDAVLLSDLAPVRYALEKPHPLPATVHQRVNRSIRSRHRQDLPGGGAWFVQRKVPGRDGIVLQVRPDPGTDEDAVRRVAADVAEKIRGAVQ